MTYEVSEALIGDVDPLWCVVLEGFDSSRERVREALAALADGRVGLGGATLAGHPGERRWAVAGGVYEGDGPATHLLPGPVGFHLPYEIEQGAPLRRVIDLRSGVVWEHCVTDAGALHAVRFASLARPGLSVLRAQCPDSRRGPPLKPSTDGTVAEQGVDGDVTWMTALSTSPAGGGIAAAAHEKRNATGDRNEEMVLDRVVAYATATDGPPDTGFAVRTRPGSRRARLRPAAGRAPPGVEQPMGRRGHLHRG